MSRHPRTPWHQSWWAAYAIGIVTGAGAATIAWGLALL